MNEKEIKNENEKEQEEKQPTTRELLLEIQKKMDKALELIEKILKLG